MKCPPGILGSTCGPVICCTLKICRQGEVGRDGVTFGIGGIFGGLGATLVKDFLLIFNRTLVDSALV